MMLGHGRDEDALHEYRDQRVRVNMALGALHAKESGWHAPWRFWRRSTAPRLTEGTLRVAEEFLERWRERVTRHGGDPIPVYDRTRRTTDKALTELPTLNLT